jgi:threonine dehydrogenase-like Zn-dependent dehydrogenase
MRLKIAVSAVRLRPRAPFVLFPSSIRKSIGKRGFLIAQRQVLVEQARLKEGQKILIRGGSGGVGTFAIQLAKHLGAEVATTTSKANVDLVKRLGVDVVIDYKSEKFETLLSGYDVALNSLAGDKGVTLFQRTMSRLMREADRS